MGTVVSMEHIRGQFPILSQKIDGHPLVYLDNAATTQKPKVVIDALTTFYEGSNANVKRGMHVLAERATDIYENARKRTQQFLHAKKPHEIIFTKGTTEAINLVANSYGRAFLKEGDEIIIGPYNVVSKTLKSGDKVQQKKVEAKKEEENE